MIHHLWFYLKQCTRCLSLHGALLIGRLATVGVFVQWGVCYITFLLFRGMSILLIPKWFSKFILGIVKGRKEICQHNRKFTTTFQYIRSDPLFIGIESGAKTSWLHFLICADPYRLHFKDNPVTDVHKLFAIASSLISRFAASMVGLFKKLKVSLEANCSMPHVIHQTHVWLFALLLSLYRWHWRCLREKHGKLSSELLYDSCYSSN